MELLYILRDRNYRIQQIRDGHVYNKKVDGFSHGFRLVDDYSDDGVPSQRNNEDQAESKGYSNFFCRRSAGATRRLCSIHRSINAFRHCR